MESVLLAISGTSDISGFNLFIRQDKVVVEVDSISQHNTIVPIVTCQV